MRISDWSSGVCSADLAAPADCRTSNAAVLPRLLATVEPRANTVLRALVILAFVALPLTAAVAPAMLAAAGTDASAERARIAAVTRPTAAFSKPESYELRSAGAATVLGPSDPNPFSLPSANLSFQRRTDLTLGHGLFR